MLCYSFLFIFETVELCQTTYQQQNEMTLSRFFISLLWLQQTISESIAMGPVLGCDLTQKGPVPALSSPGSFICYIKGSNSYLSRGSPNLLAAHIWRTHTHTPRHFIRFPSFPIFHTCSVLSVEPIRSLALRVNIYWWFLKSATTSPSSLPVLNPPPSIALNTTVPLSVEFVSFSLPPQFHVRYCLWGSLVYRRKDPELRC